MAKIDFEQNPREPSAFLALIAPAEPKPEVKATIRVAPMDINGKRFVGVVNANVEVSVIPENGPIARQFKHLKTKCVTTFALHHETSVIRCYEKIPLKISPMWSANCKYEHEEFIIIPATYKVCEQDFILSNRMWNTFNHKCVVRSEIPQSYTVRHPKGLIFATKVKTEIKYEGTIKRTVNLDFVGLNCRYKDFKMLSDEYPDHMFSPLEAYRTMNVIPMEIRLLPGRNSPKYMKPKNYNYEDEVILRKLVVDLLRKGVLERSNSKWNSRATFVQKKDGSYRLVLNCRRLNEATFDLNLTCDQRVPKVLDIVDYCERMQFKFFSNLDCRQSTYQVALAEKDRYKTAFETPFGKFQYTRLPFGTKNSSKYFQMKMNKIFDTPGGISHRCSIYVDDILVYGRTQAEHDTNLRWVLDRCESAGIKLNLPKCVIGQKEAEYCGFTAARHFKPIRSKVEKWIEQGFPRNVDELDHFLTSTSMYSMYLNDYKEHFVVLKEFADLVNERGIEGQFEDHICIAEYESDLYMAAQRAHQVLISYLMNLVEGKYIHIKD